MFDERLKSLRKKCGYTQVSLAETLGVSKGTVAMWETGKRTPDFETLIRLSDLFDVRTDYILGKSNDSSSAKILSNPKRNAAKNKILYRMFLIWQCRLL